MGLVVVYDWQLYLAGCQYCYTDKYTENSHLVIANILQVYISCR